MVTSRMTQSVDWEGKAKGALWDISHLRHGGRALALTTTDNPTTIGPRLYLMTFYGEAWAKRATWENVIPLCHSGHPVQIPHRRGTRTLEGIRQMIR